jgi:hypothetical protein
MSEWLPFSEVFTGTPTLTDPLIVAQVSGNNGTSWDVAVKSEYTSQLNSATQIRIGVSFWDGSNNIGVSFADSGPHYVDVWGDNPITITDVSIDWTDFTLSTIFPFDWPSNGLLELDIHLFLEADEPSSCRWQSFVGTVEVC